MLAIVPFPEAKFSYDTSSLVKNYETEKYVACHTVLVQAE